MGLDSFYKKNLEQRAKYDTGAIDSQWIKENESEDTLYVSIAEENKRLEKLNKQIRYLKGKESLAGEASKKADDLLAELEAMLVNNENESTSSKQIDTEGAKTNTQENFLDGLNQCKNIKEIQHYVDNIVNRLEEQQTCAKLIGARRGVSLGRALYQDGGYYDKFISSETQILNNTIGSGFHIYDRDYLYQFANEIKSLHLNTNSNVLQYIMPFLDRYFGVPKDQVDRREDTFWEVCEPYAENFYKKKGINYDELFDSAIQYMQYNGEFPLRALKGKNVAQCVERSCLVQNILKMCGYESSINFGDAESHGNVECHAWNIIRYNNGYLLIDFSNTAHEIENGSVVGRRPFSFSISLQDFEEYKSGKKDLITRDFHYEKGKKVWEPGNRIYAVGRNINKNILVDEFKEAAEDLKTIEARSKVFDDLTRAQLNNLEQENQNERG